MSKLRLFLIIAVFSATVPSVAAAQDGWVRALVRERGNVELLPMISCAPPTGLKEIVAETQLTVEGIVARAHSALTHRAASPDDEDLYTDYVIQVTRVFRMAPGMVSRHTPGATEASPFIAAELASRAAPSPLNVRVRALYHGRLALDGGVVTQ